MPFENVKDRLESFTGQVRQGIGLVGDLGGFGVVGSIVNSHSPDLGQKMRQIQQVHDTFGVQATSTLLATDVAAAALKRLPEKTREALRGGVRRAATARPMLSRVLHLAEMIARKV